MSEQYFDQKRAGGGWKRRNFLSAALASAAAVTLPGASVLAALGKGESGGMLLGRNGGILTGNDGALREERGSVGEREGSEGGRAELTIRDVIDKLQADVPGAPFPQTVDTIKAGDWGQPVKGIVTTMFATDVVIEKTISLGANFIIAHEPTFYNHLDETACTEVQKGSAGQSWDRRMAFPRWSASAPTGWGKDGRYVCARLAQILCCGQSLFGGDAAYFVAGDDDEYEGEAGDHQVKIYWRSGAAMSQGRAVARCCGRKIADRPAAEV